QRGNRQLRPTDRRHRAPSRNFLSFAERIGRLVLRQPFRARTASFVAPIPRHQWAVRTTPLSLPSQELGDGAAGLADPHHAVEVTAAAFDLNVLDRRAVDLDQ